MFIIIYTLIYNINMNSYRTKRILTIANNSANVSNYIFNFKVDTYRL